MQSSTAVKVYRNTITQITLPTHLSVKHPRDIKEVKNVRYEVLGSQKLSMRVFTIFMYLQLAT